MDFLNKITKETLIICNQSDKEKILKRNKLINIKILTIKEFISKYCFDYNEKTILYVMKKYNIKYEIAKIYVQNIYYIENKEYNVEKLDNLVKLKRELIDNDLLIYNNMFKEYIQKIDIIVYGIELNKYEKSIFGNLNYTYIPKKENNYLHKVIYFNTMEEEIEYIAFQICSLIADGFSPENIKLTNVDSSYYNSLSRIFTLFGLRINIPYESPLVSYDYIREFIDNYKNNNLEYAVNLLDKKHQLYDELINVINKYIKYDDKELIIYKLSQATIKGHQYINGINIINFLEYTPEDNDYIFMLSFNDGCIPNSYKDIDYITDNLKVLVNLDTTKEKNIALRKNIIKAINNIKNLTITYKLKDTKKTYYPSSLCHNFRIEQGILDQSVSYSETYNKIKLIKSIDEYIKYGYKNEYFDILNNNYHVKYNSFDNKYTKISKQYDYLSMSYSKMQVYNKCAFRYYLSNILKIDIYEDNFNAVIGRMVHFVLEKCLKNNNQNIDEYIEEFIKDLNLTKKELFFLDKYKKGINELLTQIMLENEYNSFDCAMYEKEIEIDLDDNVKFKGIIDKVLYKEDNDKTYIALIDYKTGSDDISLNYLNYGINIQLPIYLYLSDHLDFRNKKYCGFYLQKFNLNNKDYRLVGYSNSNPDILSIIDSNYSNSKIIKSMKTLKDGSFSSHAKILNDDEINKIKNITKEKIDEVITNIKNNDFSINPKVAGDKNIGCEFCKYKDICFVKIHNQIKITEEKFGGDENGMD